MKIINKLLTAALALFMVTGCYEGIDPISEVAPGADASAPQIIVVTPAEGYQIKVPDLTAPISIQVEVTDDIELKQVVVAIDGTDVKTYTEFRDYRRLLATHVQEGITNGDHVISIKATDIEGKTSQKDVHFAKVSPYNPKFDGEVFYMPFEGDYMEMISFKFATKVGNPGFATGGILDGKAYAGATDSYLTFPLEGLKSSEFSAAFWYKPNSSPDRSGILSASPTGENRQKGFRVFREGSATEQRIKLNVGTGSGETWNDGDVFAVPTSGWMHIAITISGTKAAIYFNGALAREVDNSGLDWTGIDYISIGSGAPNFAYWDHKSDLSQYDELRFFNKALTSSEIQNIIFNDSPYIPKYTGETFYMPFNGNFRELVSMTDATVVGEPGFADTGVIGGAYAGATNSYLSFPATQLMTANFSAVFWMNINAVPDRAGILVIGPEDTAAADPAKQNNRKTGFRFFRENAAGKQRFKLNVGNGTADTWVDGGALADVAPDAGWTHFGFTISANKAIVYINGEVVKESDITGISWDGCDNMSIMSGVPRFSGWDHLSDLSHLDELRLFSKVLTQSEIQGIMNAEK